MLRFVRCGGRHWWDETADMKTAILVNGVPASGKSMLARNLVSGLTKQRVAAVPFALDTVKEALFAQIGTGDREYNRMLGRASYHAIFNTIAEFPDSLIPVIDAWHGFQPKEVLTSHLKMARIENVLEIWCHVSPDVAAARYRKRSAERHGGHLPASYAEELFELAGTAKPVSIGPVLTTSGEQAFDPTVIEWVMSHINPAG